MTLRNTWYWRDDSRPKLRELAAEVAGHTEWGAYGEYCANRERGLREKAFEILDNFISVFRSAPFVERRRFVSWLMNRVDGSREGGFELPHPLWENLVEPTLHEWTTVDPDCSDPHRWIGDADHLKQALQV